MTSKEALLLHQLTQARYWSERTSLKTQISPSPTGATTAELKRVPEQWELISGLTLHDWQEKAVRRWFEAKQRGVMKVVTGAGKTLLALAIAEQLQRNLDRQLRMAIVVPTTVLVDQWRDEILSRSNLPTDAIGTLGAGHNDRFTERTRILICVLNSASAKLANEVERAGIGEHLLLVVDECHRAGAAEMRRVFATSRAYSLGLSATPERDDDDAAEADTPEDTDRLDPVKTFNDSVIGRELGPVVFELNYADAIESGILPPFSIVHYGLSLETQERDRYERISREITDLRRELETRKRRGLALVRWCRSPAAANDPRAVRFISLTSDRKRLLFSMSQRTAAVATLLQEAYSKNENARVILFHESISEVMKLFADLRLSGYSVVAEHSEFPDKIRAESIYLFRHGIAKIIVSARSLIEGFNVPTADLGIIVAASSSVRQRVQTLGRLLRKSEQTGDKEKQAKLIVLYAKDTVDELIYEKADWDTFIGAERNEYFQWNVCSARPVATDGPPRQPAKEESQIDLNSIRPGDVYIGRDEGEVYSRDTQGNVTDSEGRLLIASVELNNILSTYMKNGGRFRVTPKRKLVLKLQKRNGEWQKIFLGRLTSSLIPAETLRNGIRTDQTFRPGSPYPLEKAKGKTFSVLQRDERLIARKEKGKISFVRPASDLADPAKRERLIQLQREIATTYARGHRINKIVVTDDGHVVYLSHGMAYFLGIAPEGRSGFVFED